MSLIPYVNCTNTVGNQRELVEHLTGLRYSRSLNLPATTVALAKSNAVAFQKSNAVAL